MPIRALGGFGSGFVGMSAGDYGGWHRWSYDQVRNQDDIACGSIGVGQFVARALSRPETYTVEEFEFNVANPGGIREIIFYEPTSNAILGRIWAGIETGSIGSVKFIKKRGDCGECTFTLSRLPDFEIVEFSRFSIFIGNGKKPRWSGRITQLPQPGSSPGEYEFQGHGMKQIFERERRPGIYDAATDIGVIAHDLIEQVADDGTPHFRFNPGKLNQSTGVVSIGAIDLARANVSRVMESLGEFTRHDWGVDAEFQPFFLPRETGVVKTLFDGISYGKAAVKVDPTTVVNSWIVKRQDTDGSGDSGWTIGAQESDATSIARYGVQPDDASVPGNFDDYDCEDFARRLIEETKDPQTSIKITGIPLRSDSDFWGRGLHRIVGPFETIRETLHECDDLDTVNLVGAGDAVLALEEDTIHSGAASLSVTFEAGSGSRLDLDTDFSGNFRTLRIWIYCTQRGISLTLGVGEDFWDENTFEFETTVTGRYYPVEFDISAKSISRIKKIGLLINTYASIQTQLYVDSISATRLGHAIYDLEPDREEYDFQPNREGVVNIDYGPIPNRIEHYIVNAKKTMDELEYVVEQRD